MKKLIVLILALTVFLSLAGCGSAASQEMPSQPPETAAPTQVSATEPPATEPPATEAPATEPNLTDFDPYWAGEELEMPIPQPPFTAEVEYEQDRNRYTISSADTDEMRELDPQAIRDYCEILKALGFSDSLREQDLETGIERVGYEFYGERNGNSCVMLIDEGNSCLIMVIVTE